MVVACARCGQPVAEYDASKIPATFSPIVAKYLREARVTHVMGDARCGQLTTFSGTVK